MKKWMIAAGMLLMSASALAWGNLNGYEMYCQSRDLCTWNIQWSTYGSTSVTVQEYGSPEGEKLFACSNGSMSQQAPWIKAGQSYLFRVYQTPDCYNGWRWATPTDQMNVTGRWH